MVMMEKDISGRFKCKRCLTEFDYKSCLISHIKRKIPCDIHADGEDLSNDEYLKEFERPDYKWLW